MHYLIGVIFTALATLFPYLSVQAVDFESCKECHKETLDKFLSRRFLHPPFAEQECAECHAAEESATQGKNNLTGQGNQRKIKRLVDSGKADITHAFLLPGEKVGDILVIDLQGNDGKVFTQKIAVPPLADLAAVMDRGRPPVISEVRVLKVQRAAFISATIGWKTDTLTDDSVRYGDTDLSQTSDPSPRLGRQHQVVLYNLKSDHNYRFSVVSTDLFGRRQVSEPLEFSTSNADFKLPPPAGSGSEPVDGLTPVIESRFYRHQKDYLFELILEQPAWVRIGSVGGEQKNDKNRGLPDDEFHADLSGMVVSSMKACLNCHSAHSHPLNVPPKQGMAIIPEYPTLPDGRITCSSCHEPHGSDYYFLTRKHFERDLCIGCHSDMTKTGKPTKP